MSSDERWERLPLGSVVTLKRGYDLPERERETGEVPIFSSSGLSGYHNETKVAGPGVVTGRYGTIGKVFYIEHDFWPLNTALFVEDFHGNNPRYCAELLHSLNFNAFSSKSGVPGVNRNDLHQAEVLVAPRSVQVKIAYIATVFDAKISSNRQLVERIEECVDVCFNAWFNEFIHEDAFVKTELGRTPKGWDICPIGSVLKVVGGGTPSTKESRYWDGGQHSWATPNPDPPFSLR